MSEDVNAMLDEAEDPRRSDWASLRSEVERLGQFLVFYEAHGKRQRLRAERLQRKLDEAHAELARLRDLVREQSCGGAP